MVKLDTEAVNNMLYELYKEHILTKKEYDSATMRFLKWAHRRGYR